MKRKGQVWVETVIYILIGLSLIALVLAFVTPRINEQRDRIVVEQALLSLNVLDGKINEVINMGRNNKRIIDFSIRKGALHINSEKDEIVFVLDGLTKPYSEPGLDIPIGRVIVRTIEGKKTSSVNLTLEYAPENNLISGGEEKNTKLNPAPLPYRLSIENKGQIDIIQIS